MPVTPALIDSWLDMHRQACSSQEACARELPRQGPLWIYGAGRFGRELASGLQQQGLSVAGFIDQRAQGPVNGLPCIPRRKTAGMATACCWASTIPAPT